jgi:DNA polymerase IV
VAKVASEKSKPDGLLEIPAGFERDFLSPLPVGDLPGIGKKSEQVLKGLGISTVGQLAAAPASLLKSRFGIWGEYMQQRAVGIDESKVEARGEAKSISRETTFAQDTRDIAFLKATLRYLGERVGAELRESGKQTRCVSIKVRYADFTTVSRQHALKESASGDDVIFDTGIKLLEASLAQEKQAVRLIGIGVSNLVESGQQLSLLNPQGMRANQLDKAIDRIRDRYGFTSIQTGRTLKLKDVFHSHDGGYRLDTPSLSR